MSNKKPLTLRLDPDLIDELEAEADDRGFGSRAEYIRWIVSNRDSIDLNLVERVEQLEERVKDLEQDG